MVDLVDLVKKLSKSISQEMRCCMPGVVQDYDFATQKASIKIDMRELFSDGTTLDYPIVSGVPIVFLRSGGSSITAPVNEGDTCLVLFADRDMSNWLLGAQGEAPDSTRSHAMTDAIAIMGLGVFNRISAAENNEDMLISYDGTKIRLRPNGNLDIDTASTVNVNTQDITINCINANINAENLVQVECNDANINAKDTIAVQCKNATIKAELVVDVECENASIKASNNVNVECKNSVLKAEESVSVLCNDAKVKAIDNIKLESNTADIFITETATLTSKNIIITNSENLVVNNTESITVTSKNVTFTVEESIAVTCKNATVTATEEIITMATTLKHTGNIQVTGNIEVSGTSKLTGALTTSAGITNSGGTISSNGIVFDTHTHVYTDTIEGVPTPSVTQGPL